MLGARRGGIMIEYDTRPIRPLFKRGIKIEYNAYQFPSMEGCPRKRAAPSRCVSAANAQPLAAWWS